MAFKPALLKADARPVARSVDDFLHRCSARGLSPRTVKHGYGYPLRDVFLPFCADEGISEPGQLDRAFLDRFTTHLLEVGGKHGALSKHSVGSYVRAVNQYLGYLTAEAGKEKGTGLKAQQPRLPRALVTVLDRSEITRLEQAAQTERDKLIVLLLANTGMRLGELIRLTTSDLMLRDRSLRVHGKGERDRIVPIPKLADRLRKFIQGRPKDADGEHIFLASRRHNGLYEPLTENGVYQLIRTLADEAEIAKRVHPHLLRHSFATQALRDGMNVVLLAQILGHGSLLMIQRVYAHLAPDDASQAMARLLTAWEGA